MAVPDLSIVLLCYRAGENVRKSVSEIIALLEKSVPNFELVLVGNYNTESDITPRVVADIAAHDPRIRYSARKKAGMMGWDMKTGFALTTGEYIAVIDGDGQMPFEDIPTVYAEVRSRGADMGKTYRTVRGDDAWRIVVSHVYNVLFHVLFPGLKARDMNSKPKIFSRRALDMLHLVSDDWFIDAEIMILARRYKFHIIEHPTIFRRLEGRQSFVGFKTILEFLKNLIIFRMHEFNARA